MSNVNVTVSNEVQNSPSRWSKFNFCMSNRPMRFIFI